MPPDRKLISHPPVAVFVSPWGQNGGQTLIVWDFPGLETFDNLLDGPWAQSYSSDPSDTSTYCMLGMSSESCRWNFVMRFHACYLVPSGKEDDADENRLAELGKASLTVGTTVGGAGNLSYTKVKL